MMANCLNAFSRRNKPKETEEKPPIKKLMDRTWTTSPKPIISKKLCTHPALPTASRKKTKETPNDNASAARISPSSNVGF